MIPLVTEHRANDDDLLHPAPGALRAEVESDVVLMSPHDFVYFALEGPAVTIWELVDGVRTVGEIVDAVADVYEGDAWVVRQETLVFLDALVDAGLATR